MYLNRSMGEALTCHMISKVTKKSTACSVTLGIRRSICGE